LRGLPEDPRGASAGTDCGYDRRVSIDVAGEPPSASEIGSGAPQPAATMASVARGVSWQLLSVVLGQGFWYASLFTLAVLLPPRDFGVMAVATAVVSFTLLLLSSGTSGALIIAPKLAAASVRSALIRTSAMGLAATAVFIAAAKPIADAFAGGSNPWVLRLIAVNVVLAAVAIVPSALLMKQLRFKVYAQITIFAAAVASAAAIVAAALGAGVWALAIRLVLNQLLLVALVALAARDLLPRGVPDEAATPKPAGRTAFLVIAGASVLAWTCDNLVVGAFTSTTELGLYSLAFSLAFLPLTQVSFAVGQVLLPTIAAARDGEVVRRQTLRAFRIMALMLLPLAPPAIAAAPGLIPAVLGHKWVGTVVVFQILVGAGVGYGVLNVLAEALAGAGARSAGVRARIDSVWALATIGSIVVGVNVDGVRGAAIAHVITFFGLACAYMWRGGRGVGLGVAVLLGAVWKVLACVAVQSAVTAAVTVGLEHGAVGVLAAGLAGATAGAVALAAALRLLVPDVLADGRAVVLAAVRRRTS
jgi:O-antigen/teichoic acid export membrane protein